MRTNIRLRVGENLRLLLALYTFLPPVALAQHYGNSDADQRSARGSAGIYADKLLNSDEGLTILGAALESRHPADSEADCSHLVHLIYQRAGFSYAYANSTALYDGLPEFRQITHPQAGDLVVWRGHVGIVISPAHRSFFSAMRSGRGVEFYGSPYWRKFGRPRFYRYLKRPSQVLSASAQDGYGRSNYSDVFESSDSVPPDEPLPQPVSRNEPSSRPSARQIANTPGAPVVKRHRFGIPPSLENSYANPR